MSADRPGGKRERAVNRFSHRVVFADTDAMGIVYYANYFRYFEIGRAEWFREFMRPFTDCIAEDSYLIVLDAHCDYRKPARYDQVLTIETVIGRVDRVRIRIDHRVSNEEGELVAEGYTTHTVVDGAGRIKRMPDRFVNEMKALAG